MSLICKNPSCSMRGTSVDTERARCMSCGRILTPSGFDDLLDGLFGSTPSTPSGGGNTMSSEVRALLTKVDATLLAVIDGTGTTTKRNLRDLRAAIKQSLGDYG